MNYFKLIPALWKTKGLVQKDIKEDSMDIKDGWKTTEFWGKVAAQAVSIWGAVGGFVPPKYAAIIIVVAEGVYTIARTVLKVYQSVKPTTTVTTTEPITTVTTPA